MINEKKSEVKDDLPIALQKSFRSIKKIFHVIICKLFCTPNIFRIIK